LLDLLGHGADHVTHILEVPADISLCDVKEVLLGTIEQVKDIAGVLIRVTDRFGRNTDQFPLDMLLENDTGVELDIGSRGDAVGQLGDVERTAYQLQLGGFTELVGDGKQVDRLGLLE
jgi:hypothetical protein